jgi:hypothetical protein
MILKIILRYFAIEILAKRGKYMTEKQNTEFILTEEVINECLRLM